MSTYAATPLLVAMTGCPLRSQPEGSKCNEAGVTMDDVAEPLWQGQPGLEGWIAEVVGGYIDAISNDVIVVSTAYLYSNVTAIRTVVEVEDPGGGNQM